MNLVNEHLNNFYFYVLKIQEDKIITLEELGNFERLLNEFYDKLNSMELKQNMSKNVSNQIIKSDEKNVESISYNLLDENDKNEIHETVKSELKTQQLEAYKNYLLETKNIKLQ